MSDFAVTDTVIDFPVNWPVYQALQRTGAVDASFNCMGEFGRGLTPYGYNLASPWPPASFISPPSSGIEYLFGGSMWIGGIVGGDTLVSVGADGWQITMEMWPAGSPPQPSITKFDYIADCSMRAEFYDTVTNPNFSSLDPLDGPHRPLNLRLANRSHVWRISGADNIILYDLVVTNIGPETIENGYVGFYMDADVSHISRAYEGFADDLTGSIRSDGIAYIIDNDGDPVSGQFSPNYSPIGAFAFKFLASSSPLIDTNYNWWIPNGNLALDFGPRHKGTPEDPYRDYNGFRGTPTGDRNKYYIMRHHEWDYDEAYIAVIQNYDTTWLPKPIQANDYADGYDTRFFLSAGPFTIGPGESFRMMYSTFFADSVHHEVNNLHNLPNNPDQYTANLNLDHIIENGRIADSLALLISNWQNPSIGLRTTYKSDDSVVIAWDPWVFSPVDGYDIYLTPILFDSLPYPGVVPPWLWPAEPPHHDLTGLQSRYSFNDLDPNTLYFVNVANHSGSLTGNLGNPIIVQQRAWKATPLPNNEFLFARRGDPARIEWTPPPGVDIEHFNIYKFSDSAEAVSKYLPFYDDGYQAQFFTPADTFNIRGKNYYYYALTPHAQLDSSTGIFIDNNATDGNVYAVTAVDKYGFETPFSSDIYFNWREVRTKDVLVVINRISNSVDMVSYNTIKSFYDSVLAGYQYDFLSITDSMKTPSCSSMVTLCLDWHDLLPYQLVIVEDGFAGQVDNVEFEQKTHAYSRYLSTGGKLCVFGSLLDYQGFRIPYGFGPVFYAISDPFLKKYFAVDSVYCTGIDYYYYHSTPPYIDSLFGFIRAESLDPLIPSLSYDTSRYPFTLTMESFWPRNTAPAVTAFVVDTAADITHLYRSRYSETSRLEGKATGLKTDVDGTRTYLFGFRLWYMNYGESRQLVQYMLGDRVTSFLCGDIDHNDQINIFDIISLIDYIYKGGAAPDPYEIAEVNGKKGINVLDISFLIYYIFRQGPTPNCRLPVVSGQTDGIR